MIRPTHTISPRTAERRMWGIILCALAIASILWLASGCSRQSWREITADPAPGDLAEREWSSWQLGTTRQSNADFQQSHGTYSIRMGESVAVDPAAAQFGQAVLGALAAYGGASQFRRAGALAPVSVDSIGTGGLQSQPITAEQQAALADREATKRHNAELQAEVARLREEAAAVAHHAPAPPAATGGATP